MPNGTLKHAKELCKTIESYNSAMKPQSTYTVLMEFCLNTKSAKCAIDYLLDRWPDEDINKRNSNGATALIVACHCRNYNAIYALIEHGADVNFGNFNSEDKPLSIAYKSRDCKLRQILLKVRGIDLRVPKLIFYIYINNMTGIVAGINDEVKKKQAIQLLKRGYPADLAVSDMQMMIIAHVDVSFMYYLVSKTTPIKLQPSVPFSPYYRSIRENLSINCVQFWGDVNNKAGMCAEFGVLILLCSKLVRHSTSITPLPTEMFRVLAEYLIRDGYMAF